MFAALLSGPLSVPRLSPSPVSRQRHRQCVMSRRGRVPIKLYLQHPMVAGGPCSLLTSALAPHGSGRNLPPPEPGHLAGQRSEPPRVAFRSGERSLRPAPLCLAPHRPPALAVLAASAIRPHGRPRLGTSARLAPLLRGPFPLTCAPTSSLPLNSATVTVRTGSGRRDGTPWPVCDRHRTHQLRPRDRTLWPVCNRHRTHQLRPP